MLCIKTTCTYVALRLAKFSLIFIFTRSSQESQDPKEQKEETPALSGSFGVASWWMEIGGRKVHAVKLIEPQGC